MEILINDVMRSNSKHLDLAGYILLAFLVLLLLIFLQRTFKVKLRLDKTGLHFDDFPKEENNHKQPPSNEKTVEKAEKNDVNKLIPTDNNKEKFIKLKKIFKKYKTQYENLKNDYDELINSKINENVLLIQFSSIKEIIKYNFILFLNKSDFNKLDLKKCLLFIGKNICKELNFPLWKNENIIYNILMKNYNSFITTQYGILENNIKNLNLEKSEILEKSEKSLKNEFLKIFIDFSNENEEIKLQEFTKKIDFYYENLFKNFFDKLRETYIDIEKNINTKENEVYVEFFNNIINLIEKELKENLKNNL